MAQIRVHKSECANPRGSYLSRRGWPGRVIQERVHAGIASPRTPRPLMAHERGGAALLS